MSQASVKIRLLTELGISADDQVKTALADNALWQAGEYIKEKRRAKEVDERFEYIQLQIALRLWNIRGVEGEIGHSENGITRSYLSDGIISDLMKRVLSPVIAG